MPGRRAATADGCLSRAEFEGALIASLKREATKPEPLATVMDVDLDGLLDLNASAGHDVGDKAIATVTSALSAAAKKDGWTLGRIGGDEFALLAPGVALEPAFLRADQIRRDTNAALAKALPPGHRCTV